MEQLTKHILNIVTGEIEKTNDKLLGILFLESLKVPLINQLIPILNDKNFPLKEAIDFKTDFKQNNRNLDIGINYFTNSLSKNKKILENDILIISFNELSNIDIFIDDVNFKSLILPKNTGLCLPKHTKINSKFNKNVLILEIINKDDI